MKFIRRHGIISWHKGIAYAEIRKRDKMEINQISRKKKFLYTGLMALLIALLAALAAVKSFPGKLENMAQDGLYQRADSIPDDIKIIAIDEETLSGLGPYNNWSRGTLLTCWRF